MIYDKSVKEIAEMWKVNPRTPRHWVKMGCPHEREPGGRGKLKLNVSALKAWLKEHGLTGEMGQPKKDVTKTVDEVDLQIKTEKLKKLKQERRVRDGELHEVAECEEMQIRKIHLVKGMLLAIPRALAPVLVGLDAREIEKMLYDAVVGACNSFAGRLKDKSEKPKEAGE